MSTGRCTAAESGTLPTWSPQHLVPIPGARDVGPVRPVPVERAASLKLSRKVRLDLVTPILREARDFGFWPDFRFICAHAAQDALDSRDLQLESLQEQAAARPLRKHRFLARAAHLPTDSAGEILSVRRSFSARNSTQEILPEIEEDSSHVIGPMRFSREGRIR